MNTRKFLFIFLVTSFCFFFFSACTHLLYPAERQAYITAKQIKPSPEEIFIPVFDLDGKATKEKVHAWYFHSESKIKKGVAIHFHGNGQNLTTHFQFFRWLTQFGFDYVIFDYRGYGASDGEAATPQQTIEDGLSVFRYIKSQLKNNLNPGSAHMPVVAIGQSLGSNVLLRTLQEMGPNEWPQFVVLDSSFVSYQQAARSTLRQRWFLYPLLPLTYLAIDDSFSAKKGFEKWESIKAQYPPALYFHADQDPVIRVELGRDAFERWPGPKNRVIDSSERHTASFGDSLLWPKNREIFLKCFDTITNKKSELNFLDCAKN